MQARNAQENAETASLGFIFAAVPAAQGRARIICAGRWDGDQGQDWGHPKGSLSTPGLTRLARAAGASHWCQEDAVSAGGAQPVPGCAGTGWGTGPRWLQRNPPNPPAYLGVIHGEFERNSTSVGVPGSEWVLEGDNIPLLHSSLHLI